MATVREVTFDLLRDLGITTVFGNPGSTELTFLQDFPDDFRYVLALQESSTLAMAEGHAQATGRAALVNLHTGPGLGNAMGAMVTAWHNKSPLIVTAGQQDRRHIALEPHLSANLVDLARPYVKRSMEPFRAEDVPFEFLRAYHTAMQAPKGPVFLSIPMDDWDAEAEPLPGDRKVFYETAPDPQGLREFAQVLMKAERPAIVAGAGAERSGAFYNVVALAEKLKAEVWGEPGAPRAGFPEDHPLFRKPLALAQKVVAEQLSEYDVVLVLGAPIFKYYPYVPGPVVEGGTHVLHITEDPDEAARAAVGTSLVGGIAPAVRRLTEMLPDEADRPAPPAPEAPEEPEAKTPIPGPYLMRTIAEILPDKTTIFEETSSNRSALHEHIKISWPGGYYTAGSGGLGFAMPASVGYKLALPTRPVVCMVGDGSSAYSIQSLWTAARYGANVLFVVVNNGGYYILKGFRDSLGIGETIPGLDVPGLDPAKIAEGFGVEAETVEEAEALPGAVERAFNAGRPYLLNVLVEPVVPKLPS